MADMKPFAWYSPKLDDCITDAKKESRKTIIPWDADPFTDPLFTAADLKKARREEREACAALCDALPGQSLPAHCAAVIRARNEKGGA